MKRFLVIKPSSLGDVLHAFPAVTALVCSQKEECEVSWLIHPAFRELLDYLPFVKKKIIFDRKGLGKFITFFPALFRLISELRKERFDAVYDLQGLFRSGIFSFITGCARRYGPANPREGIAKVFYTDKLSFPQGTLHAVEKLCNMIARSENIPVPEREFLLPENRTYRESAAGKALAADLDILSMKKSGSRLVSIAPGARWKSKTWEAEFFAEIVTLLHRKYPETVFLLLGSEAEKEAVEKLGGLLKDVPYTDLCGKTTIGELVELIRYSDVLLCNDSGPMHIAAVTGTLPVAFFGPTDPDLTGPYCKNALVFQDKKTPCIKCFRRECRHLACHRGIKAENVVEKIGNFFCTIPEQTGKQEKEMTK